MTDAEQIEAWRKEFESWFNGDLNISLKRDSNGNYTFMGALSAWNAWLAAKRSQPVIELMDEESYGIGGDPFDDGYSCAIGDFKKLLTAAGYKYKVKE